MTEKTPERPTLTAKEQPDSSDLDTVEATGAAASVGAVGTMGSSPGEYLRGYIKRVTGGDMGSLPAVGALIVLVLVFSVFETGFFSLGNFANLITQAAPGVLLAMGIVFTLLLGEIDLSAGTTSGVGGAIVAVLLHNASWPWPLACLAALVAGVVIGLLIGWMRTALHVPSFVSTLALFLGLQGVVILIVNSAHTQGNLQLSSDTLNALENSNMPLWLGWVMAVICIVGFGAQKVTAVRARTKRGLGAEPMVVAAAKVIGLAVIILVAVLLLNKNRALHQGTTIQPDATGKLVKVELPALQGVPWVVPVIIVLVVAFGFVLNRTRYGRHIYAVGGNDEAARRAGIRVNAIRISAFVICSSLAMVSGIVLASETGVNNGQGGGNTLLLAVGAAVVGGTSLFGGKGKITDAVIGGLVVAVIINGMSDLLQGSNNAAWQAIVTGLVLLLAATVDALSRKRADASGLG